MLFSDKGTKTITTPNAILFNLFRPRFLKVVIDRQWDSVYNLANDDVY